MPRRAVRSPPQSTVVTLSLFLPLSLAACTETAPLADAAASAPSSTAEDAPSEIDRHGVRISVHDYAPGQFAHRDVGDKMMRDGVTQDGLEHGVGRSERRDGIRCLTLAQEVADRAKGSLAPGSASVNPHRGAGR